MVVVLWLRDHNRMVVPLVSLKTTHKRCLKQKTTRLGPVKEMQPLGFWTVFFGEDLCDIKLGLVWAWGRENSLTSPLLADPFERVGTPRDDSSWFRRVHGFSLRLQKSAIEAAQGRFLYPDGLDSVFSPSFPVSGKSGNRQGTHGHETQQRVAAFLGSPFVLGGTRTRA